MLIHNLLQLVTDFHNTFSILDTPEASVVLSDTQLELLKVPDDVTTNNWSKYSPNMLRSPRSIELMPSSLKNKILNGGKFFKVYFGCCVC